jgi:hypothetical protein
MFDSAAGAGEAAVEAAGVAAGVADVATASEADCGASLVAPHALKARTIAPASAKVDTERVNFKVSPRVIRG